MLPRSGRVRVGLRVVELRAVHGGDVAGESVLAVELVVLETIVAERREQLPQELEDLRVRLVDPDEQLRRQEGRLHDAPVASRDPSDFRFGLHKRARGVGGSTIKAAVSAV